MRNLGLAHPIDGGGTGARSAAAARAALGVDALLAGKAEQKAISGGAPSLFTTAANSVTDKFVPMLAAYRSPNTFTGAIVFLAPANLSTVMHTLTVSGFVYTATPILNAQVAAYRGSNVSAWVRPFCTHYGSFRPTIRFGRKAVYNSDGSTQSFQNCIIVGDVDTSWVSPHLVLNSALFSHPGATDAYCSGWTSEVVTALDAPVAGGAAGYDLLVIAPDVGIASKLDASLVSTFARTLTDDTSAAAMRTTLGLGGAAILSVGTAASTVAAGNDARMTGALRVDLDQLTSPTQKAQGRSNLGVQSAGTYSVEGLVLPGNAVGDTLLRNVSFTGLSRADLATSVTILTRFRTVDGAVRVVDNVAGANGPDAIQNASGDWLRLDINDGFANLTHWGGDPLGQTASDGALTRAMAWIAAGKGIGLYAPGRYLVTQGCATALQKLNIFGGSKDTSAIIFTPTSGPGQILFDVGGFGGSTDPTSAITIQNISLLAGRSGLDTAIRFRQPPDVNYQRSHDRLNTFNLRLWGVSPETTGWKDGFDLHNVMGAQHVGLEMYGQGGEAFPNNTQAKNTVSGCAYRLTGGDGGAQTYVIAVPGDHRFFGASWRSWSQGISIQGDPEGFYLHGCKAIDVRDWVQWDVQEGTGHPYIELSGCHGNVYRSVLRSTGGLLDAMCDANCLFQTNPFASEPPKLWFATGARRHRIYSTFVGYGGLSGYPGEAIHLYGNVQDCDIRPVISSDPNKFEGKTTSGFNYGVYISDPGIATYDNVIQPICQGSFGVLPISDITNRQVLSDGLVFRYYRQTTYSVPTGVQTTIPFDGVDRNPSGLVLGSDGKVTANHPATRGVMVRCRIAWASNSQGNRQLQVLKNGAGVPFGTLDVRGVAPNGIAVSAVDTPFIPLRYGEYITVQALQDSGQPLNIQSGGVSWIEVTEFR